MSVLVFDLKSKIENKWKLQLAQQSVPIKRKYTVCLYTPAFARVQIMILTFRYFIVTF